MTPAEHMRAAERLDEAERSRRQIRMLSLEHPGMSMADAYAVQAAWREVKLARGERLIGHKIGLTSKAMQAAVGIDTPDSGFLTESMAFADGGEVATSRFIGLRIEAELAFVLKAPLEGASLSISEVIAATDYITPALEILDTRIFRIDPETKRTRTVCDTIADNAANAGIVMSAQRFNPRALDLRWAGAIVARNGEIEETGLAAGVLGHPAKGIAWLAARVAEQGQSLAPGEVLLAGSFIRPIEVGAGDEIVANYGALGEVRINFG